MEDFIQIGTPDNGFGDSYLNAPENKNLSLAENCMASFFMVYHNKNFPVANFLNVFYNKQEESGAIRSEYDIETGKPVFTKENPEGISPPLLAWTEFNLFHKVGQKRRIKEVMPALEKYFEWIETNFKQANGLYAVPIEATGLPIAARKNAGAYYPVDFNSQMAISALYMSALGDILNDKDLGFKYKKHYFALKTRINNMMWDAEENFYYDLDKNEKMVKIKTLASFWPLLAELPNEDRAESLIAHLSNPQEFGTPNPFPTVAANEDCFKEDGSEWSGAVLPYYTFIVIKGLEKFGFYEFARECSIRHIYFILDTFHPDKGKKGYLWEIYKPMQEGPAKWDGNEEYNRKLLISSTGLATIALMIENVIGLFISLPRKTVDWIIPTLELMGIEDLNLRRNKITILSNKSNRGWEIRLRSEKLYYFTINILGEKKKTLPIPSGKCSMLIDKL